MKGEAFEHIHSHTRRDSDSDTEKPVVGSRSWGEFSKWLHAIQLNFGFHFGTHFLSIRTKKEKPKPLCPRFASFRSLATVNASYFHFLELPFRCCQHTHTHPRILNSFSIFTPFVPVSFKENGKFIEFILTRNMFASTRYHSMCIPRAQAHFFTHTCMHACTHTYSRTTRTLKILKDAEPANRLASKQPSNQATK